jgi:glucokinase
MLRFPVLIGDIGGTNARFALLTDAGSDPYQFPIVKTAAFATIDEAIAATLSGVSMRPRSTVLAVAGPVDGDEIPLTNCDWVVRPLRMLAELGLEEVVVLNDFEAQALAVVALGPEHLEQIGGSAPEPDASRVVLGPGTGLGVAGSGACARHLGSRSGRRRPCRHGPARRDFEVFPHIDRIEGRISGEQMLCGRGMVNLYRAVARADDVSSRS